MSTLATAVATTVSAPGRVAAVRRLVPLNDPPSATLYGLTRLAAELLETPVALLTLVDADRQVLVSTHGLGEPVSSPHQTSLDYSICQYTVACGRPLIVPDTSREPALAANLAVVELGVAAYAGVPLITADGHAVGALCVVDFAPREWSDRQVAVLADLAAVAVDGIRLAGFDRRAAFERAWSTRPKRRF